ncbi:MAG: Bacteroidetes-specific putative rane protein [Bacteroidetes bacterium]|jgi:type IX secretion system PorP/SprF family membrane protein|nr:Bacteroidetes-specific putative rane protein [Bacteroidota bacterium]MDF2451185.1 Bacteroidetes-specific putative rane protein [Bacteroidota bacterium]
MRKILYITVIVLLVGSIQAQQLPQYTQYMLNEMAINPAVAGKDNYADVRSNNRYQWMGITDAPRTYMLTLHSPLKNRHMGLGTHIYTDIVGPTRRVGISLAYAYHIKVAEKTRVSLGISAGIQQWGIDGHKLHLHDAGDENLLTQYQTKIVPDFGAGLYVHNEKWYLGFSAPQLYQSPIKLYENGDHKGTLVTHFLINGAYKFDVGEDFKVEPSFMVKYANPAPVKLDVGARVIYQEQVWLGVGYRHNDAYTALLGFMYKNYLMIGYSYDFTTTNLKKYSTGTHELMLGLRFSKQQSKHWKDDVEN